MTVVDGDPLSVPETALPNLETLMTIVGGQVAWEAERLGAEAGTDLAGP